MEKLTDLYRRVGDSLVMEECLSAFDLELRRVLRYRAITVHLVEHGALSPVYAAGDGFRDALDEDPEEGGTLEAVAASRRPAFNYSAGPAVAMAAPAVRDGCVVAVIALYRSPGACFAIEELGLVEDAAGKLAPAIDNARRFRRAELVQARALFERLDAEIARSRRSRGVLAVLDCRLSGGALPEEAQDGATAALRRSCREYDFIAPRPEGFVVVLADCGAGGVGEARARIRQVFAGLGIGVRIGVALYPEEGQDAEDLLAVAGTAGDG